MAKANQKTAKAKKGAEAAKLPDPFEIKFELTDKAREAVQRVMPLVQAQALAPGTKKVTTRNLVPADLHEIAKRTFLEWVRASDPATRY